MLKCRSPALYVQPPRKWPFRRPRFRYEMQIYNKAGVTVRPDGGRDILRRVRVHRRPITVDLARVASLFRNERKRDESTRHSTTSSGE